MADLSAVESIFFAALDKQTPQERAAFLEGACGADEDLRKHVERMLAAHPKAGSFLNRAAPGMLATLEEPPITEGPGTVIGPYKLMEQIGEGGFGLVFVAEQQHPIRRKVALKIIKPGMDSRDVIARFEAERQALALMDHPNIAKVLDAGMTVGEPGGRTAGGPAGIMAGEPSGLSRGRPYFVMELVKGVPIVEYCDQQQLTARERLELFLTVCQAVQHAHSKGIIHRDLKPSNILVAPHDGVPVVKVIDFGVAKALGQQLTDKTIYTRFAQMIGTPLYMSPEQAEINALDVDIRSDVYSLGVLLYELLTGTTPFDKKRFATAAYEEIRRIIREEEPPKPSTRLSALGETLSAVSAKRKTEPAKLSALVKGDLDWIVMKALEKDRARRYETASSFAADVRRFLAEEPIEARPPSAWYRFRKMARRNKVALTTTTVIAGALLVGTAISVWQALRATRAEHETVVQRDEAKEKRDEAETAREELRRTLYAAHLNLAQAAWEGDRVGDVLKLLSQEKAASPDLCGFEWHYWMRQCHADLRTLMLPTVLGPTYTACSADGARVSSLSADVGDPTKPPTITFKVWDTASGKEVASVTMPFRGAFGGTALSADGTRLAIGRSSGPISEKAAHELVIVDATTGQRLAAVSGLARGVLAVAFSSDGKQVAGVVVPDDQPNADTASGELNIWDAATGRQLRAIPNITGWGPRPAFSPDGARIAVVSWKPGNQLESEVKLWDIASGKLLTSLPAAIGGSWSAVTFSPDGQGLAAVGRASPAGSALHVWDIASARLRFTLHGPFRGDFVNVAFSPDSRRIACAGGDPRVGLWDAANGKELAMYRGHCSEVTAVAFSPDGRQILSASADGAVKVWDAHPRGEQLVLNPGGRPFHTAVSPDARRIATFAAPSGVVKVWDVTGKQVLSLKRSTTRDGTPSGAVAFSPKGDRLACGTSAISAGGKAWGGLTVWDGEGKELLNLEEENVAFFAVSLSPDGMRVAAAAMLGDASDGLRRQRAVRIWDIATGRQVMATEPSSAIGIRAVTFSPDGTRLATVADGWPGQPSLLVWDATTGAECARWQVPFGAGTSVAFSPDGRRVAATIFGIDSPGELIVGDLVSGELMNLGHAWGSVTFSPDGTRLASYIGLRREAAEVCLWDASTGRQLLVLKGHAGMSTQCGLAFSPSGDRIVSTGHLWPANDDVEVKIWDATPLPRPGQP